MNTWNSFGINRGRCVKLTTLQPSVSLFFKKCHILDVSQLYNPPQPVTGIVLFYVLRLLRSYIIAAEYALRTDNTETAIGHNAESVTNLNYIFLKVISFLFPSHSCRRTPAEILHIIRSFLSSPHSQSIAASFT
jgi:hypothetical protein